jgi:hypothetical protein
VLGGMKPRIGANVEEWRALWVQIEAHDAATLEEHCELWEKERGVRGSASTMSYTQAGLGTQTSLLKNFPAPSSGFKSVQKNANSDLSKPI